MIQERSQRPLIDLEYLKVFQNAFNILDMFSLYSYYSDQQALRDKLTSLYKPSYNVRDRIIVLHFDTDYYIQNQLGLNLINFLNLWRELDIPFHVMLFYTNHMGISQEISAICENSHPADRPCVVETALSSLGYDESVYTNEPDLQEDQIQYHALCLLGRAQRTHRFALYNQLHLLDEKIVMSIKGQP
jgi:hypothetical protein